MDDDVLCKEICLDVSPNLCCDRKQLKAIESHRSMVDNLIGRCPSCYYNLLRILCEMACSPDQDQFVWPMETKNITRADPNNEPTSSDDVINKDWADEDYVDPDEEKEVEVKTTAGPMEKVQVVTKVRYFLSEKQAQDFLNSCW